MLLSSSSSKLIPPPPSSTTTPHRHHHHHNSTSINTTRTKFTPTPLLSSYPLHNRPTLKYYSHLSSKLAEDGRFTDFLMIAESLVASGVNPLEFLSFVNEKSVAIGIVRAVVRGNVDVVLNVFLPGVVKLGIDPLRLIGGDAAFELLKDESRRFFDCGEVELLVSLLETLAGFEFRIEELVKPSDVIKLCVGKRSITTAARCVRIFPHVEGLICSIILEFGMAKDLESALTVFEAYKQSSTSPNMRVYRTVIDACGLCSDYIKSRAIYEELLACNVTPNTYVFNSVMNVNACDLNYTLNIYKKMEKLGVTADITSYNILLKACCLAARVELAQDIYRHLKKVETSGTLKLDVFTYSTIIKVFADAKMWRQAIGIKEEMVSSGVPLSTVTWSSLISACAHAGLVEQAVQLFDEMLQAGVQPNAQCFNSLLHACTEARQFDRAFRLFQCWKETGFPQQVLSNDNQTKLIKRIPFRPTASTYNILMKACGTDYYRAKGLMDEMSTLGLSPDNVSWSTLIDVCGGAGKVAGAMQMLRLMIEAGIQPDVVTYTTAIKVCVERGKPKLAFLLFAEMKKYQIKPNMVTYNIILRARTRYGSLQQVQQCLAIYQDMRKAGYKPNDYYLKQLIEEWCEGVIQNRDTKNCQSASRRTDFGPENLLLERVAEHLQDGSAKSLSVDLRSLTKLEARIVILAVLRKIKEKYIAGHHVKDDMLIILGEQELGAHIAKTNRSGVKEAVIRLLQHDLGIQVLSTSSTTVDNVKVEWERCKGSNLTLDEIVDTGGSLGSSPRRPILLQMYLRVTRESLHHWLRQKNVVELRRYSRTK